LIEEGLEHDYLIAQLEERHKDGVHA
jgi:hypothetical protein